MYRVAPKEEHQGGPRGVLSASFLAVSLTGLIVLALCACDARSGTGETSQKPSGGQPANAEPTEANTPKPTGTALPAAEPVPYVPPPYVGDKPPFADVLDPLSPSRYRPADATADAPLEVVTDLGYRSIATALHVDDQHLYFNQNNWIRRVRKNGVGPVEDFYQWRSLPPELRLRGDSSHLYWIAKDRLFRKLKTGPAEVESVPLRWDHRGTDFLVHAEYIYIALSGCAALTRVHKGRFADPPVEDIIYAEVEYPTFTHVASSGGTIFCGANRNVYAVRSWEQGLELLGTHPDRVWGLGVYQDRLYWHGQPDSLSRIGHVWSVPLEGGETTQHAQFFQTANGSTILNAKTGVLVHAGDALGRLSLKAHWIEQDRRGSLVREIGSAGAITMDETYYYWLHRGRCCVTPETYPDQCLAGNCCNPCTALLRLPLSYVPKNAGFPEGVQ